MRSAPQAILPALLLGACFHAATGPVPEVTSAMAHLRDWQRAAAADSTTRVAGFRRLVLDRHRAVYGPVIAVPTDDRIARYLDWLVPRLPAVHVIAGHAHELLPGTLARMASVFPVLRAENVRVFIGPSLGTTNGTVRLVDGRPMMIIGVDVQTILSDSAAPVRALLAHELAHVAHAITNPEVYAQVDAGLRGTPTPLYLSLFSEGLAVWASRQGVPEVTTAQALMSATLADESAPRCPALLPRLAADLESTDPRRLADWFFLSGTDTSIPRRFAYYAGERVAQHVVQRLGPGHMLRLGPSQILAEVRRALADSATCAR